MPICILTAVPLHPAAAVINTPTPSGLVKDISAGNGTRACSGGRTVVARGCRRGSRTAVAGGVVGVGVVVVEVAASAMDEDGGVGWAAVAVVVYIGDILRV